MVLLSIYGDERKKSCITFPLNMNQRLHVLGNRKHGQSSRKYLSRAFDLKMLRSKVLTQVRLLASHIARLGTWTWSQNVKHFWELWARVWHPMLTHHTAIQHKVQLGSIPKRFCRTNAGCHGQNTGTLSITVFEQYLLRFLHIISKTKIHGMHSNTR